MPDGVRAVIDGSSPVAPVVAAIRLLARALDDYRHSVGHRLHLGVPEIVTLAELLHRAPLRARDIGRRTGLTQGSVTALLDRLEARGFVTRHRPEENKRIIAVELTAAGDEVARGLFAPLVPLLTAAAAEPDAPDPAQIAHCLTRIAQAFEAAAAAPGGPPPV